MPVKNIRDAINETLKLEMRRDDRVVVIGEDVVGGLGGSSGVTGGMVVGFGSGPSGATVGLSGGLWRGSGLGLPNGGPVGAGPGGGRHSAAKQPTQLMPRG